MQRKILNQILNTECFYPEAYTGRVDTSYGYLFYDDIHKDYLNRNHAVILPERVEFRRRSKAGADFFQSSVRTALTNITEFYCKKGISPVIYSPYYQGFLTQLEPYLQEFHYQIRKEPFGDIILPTEKKARSEIRLKRIKYFSEELMERLYVKNQREEKSNCIKEALKRPNYYFYAGFIGEEPVASASVYYDSYRSARIGDLSNSKCIRNKECYTKKDYEIDFIVQLVLQHKKISRLPLYLYVNNPTARNDFLEAGFQSLNLHLEAWSAIYEE